MSMKYTFGAYIKEKRLAKQISLRKFAELLDISTVYLCNIKKDRNPAPKDNIIFYMAKLLMLNNAEKAELYDLAARAKSNPTISQNLPEYMEKENIRAALRTAKKHNVTDKQWKDFIRRITKESE